MRKNPKYCSSEFLAWVMAFSLGNVTMSGGASGAPYQYVIVPALGATNPTGLELPRLLNAKSIGLTITLADVTEEELRAMELIEAERRAEDEDRDAKGFHELPLPKTSRR